MAPIGPVGADVIIGLYLKSPTTEGFDGLVQFFYANMKANNVRWEGRFYTIKPKPEGIKAYD